MNFIAYTNTTGGLSLLTPPDESLVPKGAAWVRVASQDLPPRNTRDGWELVNGEIVVNQARLEAWRAAQKEKAAR